MEDGCLEFTSCCAVNVWGTQSGVALQLLCPRSVPTRNSLHVLQHILPSAHSAEPRAAPVPSPPPPTIPGGCSALCMAQQGEEQPGGSGDHFGHLCPAWGAAAFQEPTTAPSHHWLFLGLSGTQSQICPSNPAILLVLCPLPAPLPQQPPASPMSPLNAALPKNSHRRAGCGFPFNLPLVRGRVKKINK